MNKRIEINLDDKTPIETRVKLFLEANEKEYMTAFIETYFKFEHTENLVPFFFNDPDFILNLIEEIKNGKDIFGEEKPELIKAMFFLDVISAFYPVESKFKFLKGYSFEFDVDFPKNVTKIDFKNFPILNFEEWKEIQYKNREKFSNFAITMYKLREKKGIEEDSE